MKKTIITLIIFAFALNSCGIFRRAETPPDPTFDTGVVINGIRWATRNVDAPGTFAPTPQCFGMYYQWNRKKGWNNTDETVVGWDTTYPTGTRWYAENDPCPEGWRVPTANELRRLVYAGSDWVTINGVNGRLFGDAPYQIFLPAAGDRWHTSGEFGWMGRQGNRDFGRYFSRITRQPQQHIRYNTAEALFFTEDIVSVMSDWQRFGMSIRCVAEE